MAYIDPRARTTIATVFLGLSFTEGGCTDFEIVDDGGCPGGDCYTTTLNDTGYDPTGYDPTGYNPTGYDEGYYPPTTGYTDEGPLPDTGYDEGYYPTTGYTSTGPLPDTTGTGTSTDTLNTTGIDTDGTGTGTTDSTTGTTGDTDGTGTTDSTTGTTGTTGDTDTGTTGTTGGGQDAFPPAGDFGDVDFGVQELDLIGTWSLQWAPDALTPDSVITIDDGGNFIWRETSADCSTDTLATGFLWVEPGQLVMHVETWERQLPWDTLGVLGEEFPAPFRLRMTYALLGTKLGLAGPDRLTTEPYTGRAHLQEGAQGVYIAGEWNGETELWAVPAGEMLAKVIVRDRFIATLDLEPGINPESTGIVVHDQVFWAADPPIAGPTLFENGNWTCLNGCTQPAGSTLINGGNLYAYGPYAAYQRLMTFASGRTFKRDVDTDCPP